jgi:hypothetical protein
MATDPLSGVPGVPGADGGISMPLGPQAPVPSQPGAQNPTATNPLPNSSPAPVDRAGMPVASGPHVTPVR